MSKKFSTLDCCHYLLSSLINYTITNLADHVKGHSHDQINRHLKAEKLPPRLLCESVKPKIELDEAKYIFVLFDDTVLDKCHAKKIEMAQRQYSV